MKSFFKYVLATILGVIIVNVVMLFFFCLMIFVIVASSSTPVVEIKTNSVLEISLNYEIVDRAIDDPLAGWEYFQIEKKVGLNKILASIKYAQQDDRIKGIYLNLNSVTSNFGAKGVLEEIRNALVSFKESGKFIYSYSNLGYSQGAYYLATTADRIFVNPETPMMMSGLANGVVFYKDMMDKIGVKAQIFKVGIYKSAVEPYTSTEMSEASRDQMKVYLQSQWNNMTQTICASRCIEPTLLNWLVDNAGRFTVAEEQKYGLYDSALYEDQVLDTLRKVMNVNSKQKLNMVELKDYQQIVESKSSSKNKLAIIYAQGEIGEEQSNESIGLDLVKTIREIRGDSTIKAVVLRVNSPGGSALVSDILWREFDLTAKTKPLIVSMGNVAASGGYYISCAADIIVADPMTLTGSIGIFGMAVSGEKLWNDKVGLNLEMVETNSHSALGGGSVLGIGFRDLTPYEQNVFQRFVERGYETFLDRVAQGRNMTRKEVDSVAQGRVWTGKDALKVGLVDVLGGLNDAIAIAAEKAGLYNYKIESYPIEKSPFEQMLQDMSMENVKDYFVRQELGEAYEGYALMKKVSQYKSEVKAMMPYEIISNE